MHSVDRKHRKAVKSTPEGDRVGVLSRSGTDTSSEGADGHTLELLLLLLIATRPQLDDGAVTATSGRVVAALGDVTGAAAGAARVAWAVVLLVAGKAATRAEEPVLERMTGREDLTTILDARREEVGKASPERALCVALHLREAEVGGAVAVRARDRLVRAVDGDRGVLVGAYDCDELGAGDVASESLGNSMQDNATDKPNSGQEGPTVPPQPSAQPPSVGTTEKNATTASPAIGQPATAPSANAWFQGGADKQNKDKMALAVDKYLEAANFEDGSNTGMKARVVFSSVDKKCATAAALRAAARAFSTTEANIPENEIRVSLPVKFPIKEGERRLFDHWSEEGALPLPATTDWAIPPEAKDFVSPVVVCAYFKTVRNREQVPTAHIIKVAFASREGFDAALSQPITLHGQLLPMEHAPVKYGRGCFCPRLKWSRASLAMAKLSIAKTRGRGSSREDFLEPDKSVKGTDSDVESSCTVPPVPRWQRATVATQVPPPSAGDVVVAQSIVARRAGRWRNAVEPARTMESTRLLQTRRHERAGPRNGEQGEVRSRACEYSRLYGLPVFLAHWPPLGIWTDRRLAPRQCRARKSVCSLSGPA